MALREVRDPIHGFIHRSEPERKIIDLPVFQRLRRIRQLAYAHLVYPGANHTRFDHSVGAMHVAGKIAERLELDDDEKRLVRLSALLHDIGHGPFSHVSEPVLEAFYNKSKVKKKAGEQIHEVLTRQIIVEDEGLARLLSEDDRQQILGVLEGDLGDSVLKSIVSGPLDADKQDYLLRDSHFCGVRYGVYDLDRLSDTLAIHPDGYDRYLALTEDGIHALEQFVLAKYYMTTQVYRHKIRLITDAMVQRALELGVTVDGVPWLQALYRYDGSLEYIREYTSWTDDRLVNQILFGQTPDGYLKDLFIRLTDRRLYKRIVSFSLVEFTDPLVRSALADLDAEGRRMLEAKIGSYLGCDPNFIVLNVFKIKSVREQSRNTEASITVLTPEGPRNFDEVSTLFRSINEAIQDQFVEVYAPFVYRDQKHKSQTRATHKADIRELITAAIRENHSRKEGSDAN